MRLLRLASRFGSRRMFSAAGAEAIKSDTLVKNLFLQKIKEYGSRMAAGKADLLDATPETMRSLDDQLQRLAVKYNLESKDVVKELPVKKLEPAHVESVVLAMLEGKTLDDLNNGLENENRQYIEMRQKKKAEEEANASQFQTTEQQQLPPQKSKK